MVGFKNALYTQYVCANSKLSRQNEKFVTMELWNKEHTKKSVIVWTCVIE